MEPTLIVLVGLALVFAFLNGFNDSGSIVATMIFSRSIAPRWALMLTAAAEFLGPFIFGVAVARAIGNDIVLPQAIDILVLIAALVAAISWGLLASLIGIPSSSSHALIGGLVGAVIAGAGIDYIQLDGLLKIISALFFSPLAGGLFGFLAMRLIYLLASKATMKINWFFKRAQVPASMGLALSHGAIDAQKTMGVITLGLVTAGTIENFAVPFWVVAASAAAIGLGTATGARRTMRTLGRRFYRIRPVDGFATQLASGAVVLGAALTGGPISTTQVISSAILGVGSAERVNKVRWNVAGQILMAWVLTIPVTGLLAAGLWLLLHSLTA